MPARGRKTNLNNLLAAAGKELEDLIDEIIYLVGARRPEDEVPSILEDFKGIWDDFDRLFDDLTEVEVEDEHFPVLEESVNMLNVAGDKLERVETLLRNFDTVNAFYTLEEAKKILDNVALKLRNSPLREQLRNQLLLLTHVREGVHSILTWLDELITLEDTIDRNEAAERLLRDMKYTSVKFRGRTYTMQEILQLAKKELRDALGGEAALFVANVETTGREAAAEGYVPRVQQLIYRWLFGKAGAFTFFVSQAAKNPDFFKGKDRELWDYFTTSEFEARAAGLLARGASAKEFKELLQSILLAFMEKYKDQLKASPQDALAYWKEINTLAGNLATLSKRIVTPTEVKWIVYYITTSDRDIALLGTSRDAHPTSCFWTTHGDHSIPSILVEPNVAVCYVFFIYHEEDLKKLGITPPAAGYIRVTTLKDIWQLGAADGRTLIIVDENGKIVKTREGNTYIREFRDKEISNLVWGILSNILQKEFGHLNLSPTQWVYKVPAT